MKKYLIISIIAATTLILSSCEYDRYYENNNVDSINESNQTKYYPKLGHFIHPSEGVVKSEGTYRDIKFYDFVIDQDTFRLFITGDNSYSNCIVKLN